MSLAVIDASVLTAFYAADDARRQQTVERISSGSALYAPAHLDAEVVSALCRIGRHSPALADAVPGALRHLAGFPVKRIPLAPLLDRMWALRNNVTPYDAAYVALAEALGCTLVTCDLKLAQAGEARCHFDLIT